MTPETPKAPQKPERLLNAEEVAEILGVSRGFVFDHANKREPRIERVKLGGAVRFRQCDVDAFVKTTERLLNADEVAEILGVSRRFVFGHANRREPRIERVKLGGAVRFRMQDVQAFIDLCASAMEKRKK